MPAAQPSSLASVAPARLRLAGLLGERLDRSLARLTRHPYSPVFVRSDVSFEMPRIFNEYSGDISGRWLEAISLARASSATTRPTRRRSPSRCSRASAPAAGSAPRASTSRG